MFKSVLIIYLTRFITIPAIQMFGLFAKKLGSGRKEEKVLKAETPPAVIDMEVFVKFLGELSSNGVLNSYIALVAGKQQSTLGVKPQVRSIGVKSGKFVWFGTVFFPNPPPIIYSAPAAELYSLFITADDRSKLKKSTEHSVLEIRALEQMFFMVHKLDGVNVMIILDIFGAVASADGIKAMLENFTAFDHALGKAPQYFAVREGAANEAVIKSGLETMGKTAQAVDLPYTVYA